MISDFEEGEYRAPLFSQLERNSHLMWEPGQVFEKHIGIDRASHCVNEYLWKLHGYNDPLTGSILRHRRFSYIWNERKKSKILPDFSLNLFIQAKRAHHSTQSNNQLKPHINGKYWYFDVTEHQQIALEMLEEELGANALVTYASPVFHQQQDLYNHTVNQTVIENSTFPKASVLKGHERWYYDKPGTEGVANPEFEFFEGKPLLDTMRGMREQKGEFESDMHKENLAVISEALLKVVDSQSNSFRGTRFAYNNNLIDRFMESWDLSENKKVKHYLQIETFNYIWKLNWLTF